MSVLHNPVPIRYPPYKHTAALQELQRQQQPQQRRDEAMTISYPDHSSLSYGLITPPSEMRSSIDSYPNYTSTFNSAQMDSNNILVPPANSRYDLRKQPLHQSAVQPAGSYQNNNYNNYLRVRRRSNSTSTSNTAASSSTYDSSVSSSIDFESRDFNVGDFTATV